MHPEIDKLIEMALTDGQVTEKEREIILRKAEKLGLDVDEVEMYLEGKIGVSINPKNLSENLNLISDEVTIGNQVWMTKNLNVDKFRNGDPIPYAKYLLDWIYAIENKRPAYGYFENNPNNEPIYGKIYNWYAVIDKRGLAPEGWEIPSSHDWDILINELGGEEIAGEKMKSTSGNWKEFGCGDNSSGFTAEPGGYGDLFKVLLDGGNYQPGWNLEFNEQGKHSSFISTSYKYIEENDYFLLSLGVEKKHLYFDIVRCPYYGRSIEKAGKFLETLMYVRCLKIQ